MKKYIIVYLICPQSYAITFSKESQGTSQNYLLWELFVPGNSRQGEPVPLAQF